MLIFCRRSILAEQITLDASHYANQADGVAIVCMPTGIVWGVQAGGIACEHPEVEGFPLTIFEGGEGRRFDDCEFGCGNRWKMWKEPTEQEYDEYGQAIDKFLSERINDVLGNYASFKFDYDRKKEVMEGWWPVLVTFKSMWLAGGEKIFKGYMHMGNCD
jgi:hypothetical protein